MIESFVQARAAAGELTNWTVALVSVAEGREVSVGPVKVGAVKRSCLDENPTRDYRIRRIVSPGDELIDLTDAQKERALEEAIKTWEEQKAAGVHRADRRPTVPVGWAVRLQRPPERALLLVYPLDASPLEERALVGFAVSFPGRGSMIPIEYVVNEVYWENNFGWETED